MNKRVIFALCVAGCAAVLAAHCGGDNSNPGDGGNDVTVTDGGNPGDGACWSNCGPDGGCTNLGVKCTANGDCCSGNCLNGACQLSCTSDNKACSSNSECCSGTCANGTCTPLSTTCKTLGNSCAQNSECCSQFCENGICGAPSYCGQNGDSCQHNTDCCGGLCTIQQGKTVGLCTQPVGTGAQCTLVDGQLCASSQNAGDGGFLDSGIPACGGACCSRDCAPYGATHVLICQPASGCKPVGDICTKDSDCCGGLPLNNQPPSPPGVCNKASPNDPVGVCANPSGCKPNGDICRLQTNQCNATDNCCSGNVQQFDTCKQDNLGVPRCSYAGDAGCTPVSGQCASSADCCNINPCVPSGDGGMTCYPQACVPVAGLCTSDADCCPGGHCYIQGGQTSGSCQPTVTDAGTDAGCAAYGQLCTTSSDCCNSVPCTAGRCEVPIL